MRSSAFRRPDRAGRLQPDFVRRLARSHRRAFVLTALTLVRERFDIEDADPATFEILGWEPVEYGSEAGRQSASQRARETLKAKGMRNLPTLTDAIGPRFVALSEAFSLSDLESEVLALAVWLAADPLLQDALADASARQRGRPDRQLAQMLGLSLAEAQLVLSPRSRVLRLGLLLGVDVPDATAIRAAPRVVEYLSDPSAELDSVLGSVLQTTPPPKLALANYPHIRRESALALALLRGGQSSQILVYGSPGMGKTELARVLAGEAGLSLYEIGGGSEDAPLSAEQRWQALNLAQLAASRRSARVALLVDEADELLGEDRGFFAARPPARKHWRNQMLEQAQVPIVWIANTVEAIDAALLRRFDLIVNMPAPPLSVRRAMVAAAFAGSAVSARALDAIASEPRTSPAELFAAARLTRTVTEGSGCVDADQAAIGFLDGIAQATQRARISLRCKQHFAYRADWVNSDPPLSTLLERLPAQGALCLHGPPGTGKTAFARVIAEALGRDLVEQRASDLLSKWVGGTEQRLRESFDEAAATGAVLLIDEVDTFLADRSDATRSWEISATNELLACLDSFDGLVVGTTNRLTALDPAALRRFTWKVAFNLPTAAQREAMWRELCSQCSLPGKWELPSDLEGITPSDISLVYSRYRNEDEAGLIALLRAELASRGKGRRRIGFR